MNQHRNNLNIGAILKGLGAALQQQQHTRKPSGPRPQKVFAAPKPQRQTPSLPKWMGNLDVKCTDAKHFAPMPTTFMRFTTSDHGHPVAHYKCSCGRSQFYALNEQGKAFCLFTK